MAVAEAQPASSITAAANRGRVFFTVVSSVPGVGGDGSCRLADQPRAFVEQPHRRGIAVDGEREQFREIRLFEHTVFHGFAGEGRFRNGGLQAAGAPAAARLGTAVDGKVRDPAGRRARPVVHSSTGGERRVDDFAGEQLHDAVAGPRVPEKPIRVHRSPRVPVDLDGRPGAAGQELADRHVLPAEQRVFGHGAGFPVDPAAGGDAEPERLAVRGVPEQQVVEDLGGAGQQVLGGQAVVRFFLLHKDIPAQVEQRDGGVVRGQVQRAGDVPAGVEVGRYVRPPDAPA